MKVTVQRKLVAAPELLGQRWFRANGWPLAGFVPPAWLLGPESWKALRRSPEIQYVTTFTHIHALRSGQALRAPCLTLSVRAPWRRTVSRLWAAMALRHASASLVRLALHPRDAAYPAVCRTWQHRLGQLLEQRRAVTKAEFVQAALTHELPWQRTDSLVERAAVASASGG